MKTPYVILWTIVLFATGCLLISFDGNHGSWADTGFLGYLGIVIGMAGVAFPFIGTSIALLIKKKNEK